MKRLLGCVLFNAVVIISSLGTRASASSCYVFFESGAILHVWGPDKRPSVEVSPRGRRAEHRAQLPL